MIDAHVHHWELGRFRYPWLDAAEFADPRTDYQPVYSSRTAPGRRPDDDRLP